MKKFIIGLIIGLSFIAFSAKAASVLFPYQGGTGTGVVPATGYVLVGQTNGTYLPQATSTLGISGGGTNYWSDNGSVLTPAISTRGLTINGTSTLATTTMSYNSLIGNSQDYFQPYEYTIPAGVLAGSKLPIDEGYGDLVFNGSDLGTQTVGIISDSGIRSANDTDANISFSGLSDPYATTSVIDFNVPSDELSFENAQQYNFDNDVFIGSSTDANIQFGTAQIAPSLYAPVISCNSPDVAFLFGDLCFVNGNLFLNNTNSATNVSLFLQNSDSSANPIQIYSSSSDDVLHFSSLGNPGTTPGGYQFDGDVSSTFIGPIVADDNLVDNASTSLQDLLVNNNLIVYGTSYFWGNLTAQQSDFASIITNDLEVGSGDYHQGDCSLESGVSGDFCIDDGYDGGTSLTQSNVFSVYEATSTFRGGNVGIGTSNPTTALTVNGTELATMNRQSDTWHCYGGFNSMSYSETLTVNTWKQITNSSNNLITLLENNGMTMASDTLTILNNGDYTGTLSLTFGGTSNNRYLIRAYDITQSKQMGEMVGLSTTGTSGGNYNDLDLVLPVYLEDVNAKDKIEFQIENINDSNAVILDDMAFSLMYLHD